MLAGRRAAPGPCQGHARAAPGSASSPATPANRSIRPQARPAAAPDATQHVNKI